ncbi:MAG: alkaline phosphatase family protein [Isosphaeraceae bacterium]
MAPGVHPSLPNYLWQEAGTNFGVANDNQPFGPGGANQGDALNLSALLQAKGISWKSYQEDTDINNQTGKVLPTSQWTVPLNNSSGTFTSGTNPYNGSNQYNFATKHDGQLYFNATNGGNDTTPSNPLASHYAPLQQLQTDLANNTVARYNLITPDQFNDMHSALPNGFTYHGTHYTGDQAAVAQGDNFLSMVVPMIMSSAAYKNGGAIVIWYDETEGGDTKQFTLPEIVLSPLAKGDAYDSTLTYTHSSDLKTMEELFGVYNPDGSFLGDAGTLGTNDLSDLFVAGSVVPEPSSLVLYAIGAACLAGWHWGRRKRAHHFRATHPGCAHR